MSYVLAIKLAVAVGLAAGAVVVYKRHAEGLRDEGRQEIRTENLANALATDQEYRRMEAKRVSDQAAIQQRKNDEIASLDRRLADALGELQQRPDRPRGDATSAADSSSAKACTGAGLYRADAEFLTREAARAQRILLERDACHATYDTLTVKP